MGKGWGEGGGPGVCQWQIHCISRYKLNAESHEDSLHGQGCSSLAFLSSAGRRSVVPHPQGVPQGVLSIHQSGPSPGTPLTPTAPLFQKQSILGYSPERYLCTDGRALTSFLPSLVRQTNNTCNPQGK